MGIWADDLPRGLRQMAVFVGHHHLKGYERRNDVKKETFIEDDMSSCHATCPVMVEYI